MIAIDIENGDISLGVFENIIAERGKMWKPPIPPVKKGSYLDRYSRIVGSAMSGAIFK